jgi:predicted MFS family arabinose efflux permease
MVVLAIVYMFNFVDRQILAILLPAIRADFGVSDTVLGMLAGTAFALFYATLGVPIALLADRWNRRNLIALALALWSGMTALSGLAANIWQLTLARIGVGIGEAGCSPPAHSMIADYYPPEARSTAMGFYTLGISAGIMLAYLAGGWVVANIGWREAFFIVGLPGLALAIIVRATVVEPSRGASESRTDPGEHPPLADVAKFLLRRRSFLHMAVAAGLSAFTGYAVISFFPSFIVRSYDMQIVSLGIYLGLILGIAGGFGFFSGGYFADRFGRVRQRNALWFIAVTQLATAALYCGVFLAPTAAWCLLAFIVPAAVSNFYLAPVLAQTQSLVALRMRGVASAIMLLILNLIGLGAGPLVVGWLSDALAFRFAEDSLRWALMICCVALLPWAAIHYYAAGRSIEADLARAR